MFLTRYFFVVENENENENENEIVSGCVGYRKMI